MMVILNAHQFNIVRIENVIEDGIVIDEMACVKSEDIGWICREMLRWYDKMCDKSDELAKSARKRQTSKPIGQIYYRHKLKQGKQ